MSNVSYFRYNYEKFTIYSSFEVWISYKRLMGVGLKNKIKTVWLYVKLLIQNNLICLWKTKNEFILKDNDGDTAHNAEKDVWRNLEMVSSQFVTAAHVAEYAVVWSQAVSSQFVFTLLQNKGLIIYLLNITPNMYMHLLSMENIGLFLFKF